jgi:transcriptional regulator with XRE-family HTH domain
MFEALAGVIRLRRMQQNLTLDQLARKARVNRRHLELLESGQPVGVELVVKVARALKLTDLPVGELRSEEAPRDVATIEQALAVLRSVEQTSPGIESTAEEVRAASSALDEIIWQVRKKPTPAGLAAVLPFPTGR